MDCGHWILDWSNGYLTTASDGRSALLDRGPRADSRGQPNGRHKPGHPLSVHMADINRCRHYLYCKEGTLTLNHHSPILNLVVDGNIFGPQQPGCPTTDPNPNSCPPGTAKPTESKKLLATSPETRLIHLDTNHSNSISPIPQWNKIWPKSSRRTWEWSQQKKTGNAWTSPEVNARFLDHHK